MQCFWIQFHDPIIRQYQMKWYFCKTNKSWPLRKHSVDSYEIRHPPPKLLSEIHDGNSASMNPIWSYSVHRSLLKQKFLAFAGTNNQGWSVLGFHSRIIFRQYQMILLQHWYKSWPLNKIQWLHVRFETHTKLQIHDGNSTWTNPIWSYICTGVSSNKRA